MKILIVSLLRLGDILMTAPTIRALRIQHPRAEIHVWIHREFEHVRHLLTDVDVWHCLERKSILNSFRSDGHHSFFGYDLLKEQVTYLNSIHFDAVFNLTNTRLSAVLAGALKARQHVGVIRNENDQVEIHGHAFQEFNRNPESQIHFMDLIWKGSGFSGAVRTPSDLFGNFMESDLLNDDRFLIQLTTSDTKKSWRRERWHQAIQGLLEVYPQAHFTVVGAEFERDQIEPVVTSWKSVGLPVYFQAANLKEAAQLIRQHRHFLTLDTATKHLAMGSRAQVVELSLGSSRPSETGIYNDRALILHGDVPCAPCHHKAKCSRPQHECSGAILASQLVLAVKKPHHAIAFQVQIDPVAGFQIQKINQQHDRNYESKEIFQ